MKKRIINKGLIFLFILAVVLSIKGIDVKAKTYKSIPNGGYISKFKSAKISNGKLVIKGTVTNWERADNTNAYKKAGTHKLKLSKNVKYWTDINRLIRFQKRNLTNYVRRRMACIKE